jgi:hypothetical protein
LKKVTRVPERIGLAKSLEEAISVADMNRILHLLGPAFEKCYLGPT